MAGTHSRLSPSGAHGWLRCPGKPNAEAGLEDRPTRFAAEGTVYHEVAELCLKQGLEPENFAGAVLDADGFDITVGEDMLRHLRSSVDRIRELITGDKTVYVFELLVDLSDVYGIPGEGGTLDVGIIHVETRKIIIWDHKYGAGIPVDPVENEQLLVYLLGFWNMVAWKYLGNPDGVTVDIHIDQPRVAGGGGTWSTTMDAALAWGEKLPEAAAATLDVTAPRVPGPKQCRMCKARRAPLRCPEYQTYSFDLAGLDFEELDDAIELGAAVMPVDATTLTPERRAWIVLHADHVRRWLDDLHAITLIEALRGDPTPGIKPIAGREGKRTYLKEHDAEIEAALRSTGLGDDEVFAKKLISPTQAEAKIGKERYDELLKPLVRRAPAKPVLVSEHHKKPRLATWDDFEDEDVNLETEEDG